MRRNITTAALVLGLSGWGAAAYAGPVTFNAGLDVDSNYTFVVPATGIYEITAFGAAGGAASISETLGGDGAEIVGDFDLSAGDTLDIVVGQWGTGGGNAGFGGGGSFVYDATLSELLEAAGGGGGAGSGFDGVDAPGDPGQTGPDGDAGTSFEFGPSQGAGGTGGDGGGAGNSNGNAGGGGGGGFLTDGGTSFTGTGGTSFLPFLGAAGNSYLGGTHGGSGGGGGGGYSGGGGGGLDGAGGGGGSFDAGLPDANFLDDGNVESGNGVVEISLVSTPSAAPEPASVALLGVGLCSLGLIRRRRVA